VSTAQDIAEAPHYVYRAFDSYGLLLYIGCSHNVEKRLVQHQYGPWHRYAETVGTWGPFPFEVARHVEAEAIESESSYFNATIGDMARSRANRHAAQVVVRQRWAYGDRACGRQIDQMQQTLSDSGQYPRLTVADRLARYLAAREDAESARLDGAA
jgi:predicted GIY-YIG superfamily endonuclease